MKLILGDCLSAMREMDSDSIDACVTDPPCGIGFMGKTWDKPGVLGVSGGVAMPATMASRNPICRRCRKHQRGKPPRPVCQCPEPDFDTTDGVRRERDLFVGFLTPILAECLRVAKPGARLLCWAIPRTSHWTGMAVEDAGWQIENRVAHLFGSGFPKGKSQLKPACEDWWLARKPGGKVPPLQIDACRIQSGPSEGGTTSGDSAFGQGSGWNPHNNRPTQIDRSMVIGRWPANVLLQHVGGPEGCRPAGTRRVKGSNQPGKTNGEISSAIGFGEAAGKARKAVYHTDPEAYGMETVENYLCVEGCPIKALDEMSGERPGCKSPSAAKCTSKYRPEQGKYQPQGPIYPDNGGASRFFATFPPEPDATFNYFGKASRRDRNDGCDDLYWRRDPSRPSGYAPIDAAEWATLPDDERARGNIHSTVKPVDLMRWLTRLICPPGDTILDPFMGSGSTGVACIAEGFHFIGIENDPAYFTIAESRLAAAVAASSAAHPLFAATTAADPPPATA